MDSFLRRSAEEVFVWKMLSPYLGAGILFLSLTGLVSKRHFVHLVLCIFLVGCFETVRFSVRSCSPLVLVSSLIGHALLLLPFYQTAPSPLSLIVCLSVLLFSLLLLYWRREWPYASTPVEVASLCAAFLFLRRI